MTGLGDECCGREAGHSGECGYWCSTCLGEGVEDGQTCPDCCGVGWWTDDGWPHPELAESSERVDC